MKVNKLFNYQTSWARKWHYKIAKTQYFNLWPKIMEVHGAKTMELVQNHLVF